MSDATTSLIDDVHIEQGWGIFNTDGELQIQRIDPVGNDQEAVFQNDYEAWRFVWAQANAGDVVCQNALSQIAKESPNEYQQIVDHCTQL